MSTCVACEQCEATTTCGAPTHQCPLCQACRDIQDGYEYENYPEQGDS